MTYNYLISSRPFPNFSWNEWLGLPVRFSDLPRHAVVAMTIWDVHSPRKKVPIGGTTFTLFGKHGLVFIVSRSFRLCVWYMYAEMISRSSQYVEKRHARLEGLARR